jgi:hypothetical protein
MNPRKYSDQVQENAKHLIHKLGSYSSNKSALLHILCDNVPRKHASSLFNIPEGIIMAPRSMTEKDLMNSLLFVKQKSGKDKEYPIWKANSSRNF